MLNFNHKGANMEVKKYPVVKHHYDMLRDDVSKVIKKLDRELAFYRFYFDSRVKGVEIIWDPQFEQLDALESPAIPWEKRCYFINTKYLELHDDTMDIVSPTRPYNVLALYQMVNLRLALVMKRANAHSVMSIA